MILINLSLKLNELLHNDDDSVDDAPDGLSPFISINLPILFPSYRILSQPKSQVREAALFAVISIFQWCKLKSCAFLQYM